MWMSGPITIVHNATICHELAALAKIDLGMRAWFSDKHRGTSVVLGNHPIDVRMIGK